MHREHNRSRRLYVTSDERESGGQRRLIVATDAGSKPFLCRRGKAVRAAAAKEQQARQTGGQRKKAAGERRVLGLWSGTYVKPVRPLLGMRPAARHVGTNAGKGGERSLERRECLPSRAAKAVWDGRQRQVLLPASILSLVRYGPLALAVVAASLGVAAVKAGKAQETAQLRAKVGCTHAGVVAMLGASICSSSASKKPKAERCALVSAGHASW